MTNNGLKTIGDLRKKITQTHELISTSYHEAGHVVMGLLHFMKVESVCVYENKGSKRIDGFTHYNYLLLERIQDPELLSYLIHSQICVKYAGLVAEKYHFKNMSGSDKFPMFLRDGSSDDTLSAAALIKQYNLSTPGKKRYSYKKKLIKDTLTELKNNWEVVIIVAHGLFQKKRLSFSELKTLILKKSENKAFWKKQFKTIEYIIENHNTLDEQVIKNIFIG